MILRLISHTGKADHLPGLQSNFGELVNLGPWSQYRKLPVWTILLYEESLATVLRTFQYGMLCGFHL